jgi:outer membrane protein assembly factor BamB
MTVAGRLWAMDGTKRGHPIEHRLRRLYQKMRVYGLPTPRIRVQTGQLWSLPVGETSWSSALVAGDALYVGVDDGLAAIDLDSHTIRWEVGTGGIVSSSPALAGDLVVVGSRDGYVYAVNSASGEIEWRVATQGAVTSSPAVSGGTVFVGSHDGKLYAIE